MNHCTQIEEFISWHLTVRTTSSFRGRLSFLHNAFKSFTTFIVFLWSERRALLPATYANCNAKREDKVFFIFLTSHSCG